MALLGTGRGKDREHYRDGMQMVGAGLELAADVGAGVLLGWLIDRWMGSGPVGVLIGAGLGLSVGMWALFKRSRAITARWAVEDADRGVREPAADALESPAAPATPNERSIEPPHDGRDAEDGKELR